MSVAQFVGSPPPPPAPAGMALCRPTRPLQEDHRTVNGSENSARHHSFSGVARPSIFSARPTVSSM